MIKVKINDLKSFEMFLGVAAKFVSQGQLVIKKEYSSLYCKNPKDFSTARLLLDTNCISLDEAEKIDEIKVCIRDIPAFRSSINIIQMVEQLLETNLYIEESVEENEIIAKSIQYKGKTKFKLICVDFQVIEQYISKELSISGLSEDWSFNIDPGRLDIIQNRTGNIVNVQEDVSVYLYSECDNDGCKRVMVDLNSRKASYINSVALPIAEDYSGKLPEELGEVAIHDTSFRILNILRTVESKNLHCFFNSQYNIFFINSKIEHDNYWIKSRLLVSIIKGK